VKAKNMPKNTRRISKRNQVHVVYARLQLAQHSHTGLIKFCSCRSAVSTRHV
jgi:hypothetical protein